MKDDSKTEMKDKRWPLTDEGILPKDESWALMVSLYSDEFSAEERIEASALLQASTMSDWRDLKRDLEELRQRGDTTPKTIGVAGLSDIDRMNLIKTATHMTALYSASPKGQNERHLVNDSKWLWQFIHRYSQPLSWATLISLALTGLWQYQEMPHQELGTLSSPTQTLSLSKITETEANLSDSTKKTSVDEQEISANKQEISADKQEISADEQETSADEQEISVLDDLEEKKDRKIGQKSKKVRYRRSTSRRSNQTTPKRKARRSYKSQARRRGVSSKKATKSKAVQRPTKRISQAPKAPKPSTESRTYSRGRVINDQSILEQDLEETSRLKETKEVDKIKPDGPLPPWNNAVEQWARGEQRDALDQLIVWVKQHEKHRQHSVAIRLAMSWARVLDDERAIATLETLKTQRGMKTTLKKSSRQTKVKRVTDQQNDRDASSPRSEPLQPSSF